LEVEKINGETMTENTDRWEALPLSEFEAKVSRIQRRIHRAASRGDKDSVHRLQGLLLGSWAASCVAVERVTTNEGKGTAGVDGVKNLTNAQKWKLARSLDIRQRVKPVRRVEIPKPGRFEMRPLGIPTIADRALQALIAMALEPEWDNRFEPGMYGFRRGRGCHNAIMAIRSRILKRPQWVLDADIERFFDRVDHDALLRKLDTFPALERAIRRILKSGALKGGVFEPTEQGTPQGGPLSPVLANIALQGLVGNVEGAWPKCRAPKVIMYADDFVVLHPDREVLVKCRRIIDDWLSPLGLRLHPDKTRIVHTLEQGEDGAGFEFLGVRIQQHRVGKYAVKPALKQVYTNVRPSQRSIRRALDRVKEILAASTGSRKRQSKWIEREKLGGATAEEIVIHRLNLMIRGWCNYHRPFNSKRTFSHLDSQTYWLVRKWFIADTRGWAGKKLSPAT
jgi:RNA-directed DNA polymerase